MMPGTRPTRSAPSAVALLLDPRPQSPASPTPVAP